MTSLLTNLTCKSIIPRVRAASFVQASNYISTKDGPRNDSKSLSRQVFSSKPAATPSSQDAQHKLFTAGPVMVSDRVKKAMMQDMGTRHSNFTYVTQFVRQALLKISGARDTHTVVPISGHGTMATEAMIRTVIPRNKGKLLVMGNGRVTNQDIPNICEKSGINYEVIPVDLGVLEQQVAASDDITGVIVVHCESSTGIINPIEEIGAVIKKKLSDCLYLVDGMPTFGAVPINMQNVDFLVSTANKSLQSVPGLSFVIGNKQKLERHRGNITGLALDLADQYDELEKTGQFRYTPPTHVMLALKEALLEYIDEGGLEERAKRYRDNATVLRDGMKEMGFRQYHSDKSNNNRYIVTAFHYPTNPLFSFREFYDGLSHEGHVISTKINNPSDCFRIGSIGNIYPDDMKDLLKGVKKVCTDMKIKLPLE